MALNIHAILAMRLRPLTVVAFAAWMQRDATHHPHAFLKPSLLGQRAEGDDSAGAFVGGDLGEGGFHYALLDHAVGVAVGGYGDFDEEVGGLEFGGDVDFVDLVGLLELDDLDGLHFFGEVFDAHVAGCPG